jgi:regulatory protein SWI6
MVSAFHGFTFEYSGAYLLFWRIPLERGRELAVQYGVAPLLAPLFDFIPTAQATQLIPPNLAPSRTMTPNKRGPGSPFPFQYNPVIHSTPFPPSPTPIIPGSALKLLNQGRAQGFFTPSTSLNPVSQPSWTPGGTQMSGPSTSLRPPGNVSAPASPAPGSRKRAREASGVPTVLNGSAPDVIMYDATEPTQTGGPPPLKKARTETTLHPPLLPPAQLSLAVADPNLSGPSAANGKKGLTAYDPLPRFATKTSSHRLIDRTTLWRNTKRVPVLAAIQNHSTSVDGIIKALKAASPHIDDHPDYDLILDDQGHTPLHLAAALARTDVTDSLIKHGADIRRGSFTGETALIRAALSTHAYENQTFNKIVAQLHESIRTLDNSRRTVLHHIAHLAGVKGRAPAARYYLECVLMWIAQRENGDFKSIINLQDEHGDTALNIAARVGNRSIVKTLVDVGANRLLPNKLGLRPSDFGVEEDVSGFFFRWKFLHPP